MSDQFSSVDAAIRAFREGKVVIVVDAEDRENEDDFKNKTVDMIRLKKSERKVDFANKKSKYTVHQMIKAVQ